MSLVTGAGSGRPKLSGCRVLAKYIVWPSGEKFRPNSPKTVLIGEPRFCGEPQLMLIRWETQMSKEPGPMLPVRVDVKYKLSPSFEIVEKKSLVDELTREPRFTGADHSQNCCPSAGITVMRKLHRTSMESCTSRFI